MEDVIKAVGVNSKGFGTIPKLIMQDPTLDIKAKAIYAYFCSFAGAGVSCFPTRSKICADLGISNNTLSKYLKELAERKYISYEQIKEKGKFSHNVYTINYVIDVFMYAKPYTKFPTTVTCDTEKTDYGNLHTNNNNIKINNSYKNNNNDIYIDNQEKNKSSCPYQEIVDLYHSICVSYPKLRGLTESRKKHINARWKEYKDIEVFRELFEKTENSSFLKGENKDDWKASFDWLMKPDKFIKVLENSYKGTSSAKPKSNLPTDEDYSGGIY